MSRVRASRAGEGRRAALRSAVPCPRALPQVVQVGHALAPWVAVAEDGAGSLELMRCTSVMRNLRGRLPGCRYAGMHFDLPLSLGDVPQDVNEWDEREVIADHR